MALDPDNLMRTLFVARPRIIAAVWLVTSDAEAAEDIFQDVALKAMSEADGFQGDAHVVSWAMVAARHRAIDWLRRRKPNVVPLDDDVLDSLAAAASAADDGPGGRVTALRECLKAVPAAGRRLIEARYGEGKSCPEVAKDAGMAVDAVYQRLSRLHRALRECVERRLTGRTATS